MGKKIKKYNADSAIRSALRRTFSRSPIVREVMQIVRRERPWLRKDGSIASKPRVEYLCSECNNWHMGKNIQVDHVIPVVDPSSGFQNWDTFIGRLFCTKENLRVLCKDCHHEKTNKEKTIAVERRRKLKEQQLDDGRIPPSIIKTKTKR
jgi:hypothetical protein